MTRTQHASAAVARRSSEPAFVDPTADFPDIYALKGAGDCMAPEIPDGSKVAASKSEAYQQGDLVIVWLRPECVEPGHPVARVKRLALSVPPWVTFPHREHPKSEVAAVLALSMNSMPGKLMMVRCTDVVAIHKVIGVLTPVDQRKQLGYRPTTRLLQADPEETRKAGRKLTAAVTKRRRRSKQIPDHSPAIQINPKGSSSVSEVSP